jgi:3-oxoacyl-[acyl-carrier-protein] synthase II
MRRTDRYIQFALVCAHQVAPRRAPAAPRRRHGGTVRRHHPVRPGGASTLFDNVLVMAERGPDSHLAVLHPDGHRQRRVGAGVAIACGAVGPNFATVSACVTGGHALGESGDEIRRGDADLMIAGGV